MSDDGDNPPLAWREREGTRAAGRVRGLAQDMARSVDSPLTLPLPAQWVPPSPAGGRGDSPAFRLHFAGEQGGANGRC
jgi:hypothetical protein